MIRGRGRWLGGWIGQQSGSIFDEQEALLKTPKKLQDSLFPRRPGVVKIDIGKNTMMEVRGSKSRSEECMLLRSAEPGGV